MSIRKTAFIAGIVLLTGAGMQTASGFSLGGPSLPYQSEVFGYDRLGSSLLDGADPITYGVQNLGEEYRINVPTIFYGFDASFLDFFGSRGMEDIDKAVSHFSELPEFSSMSPDLAEFPQDATRENYKATALGLIDLKSYAMYTIMRQLGLVSPEVHVWAIRSRVLQPNQACPLYDFFVIRRNFDPISWEPSSYVNGTLYTVQWLITCAPAPDFSYIDPEPADPLSATYRSAAGANYIRGQYLTGLTRDDVGGLRYLYRPDNYNREQLPPDVFIGGGSPFAPAPTNPPTTGDTTALRTGLNKLRFEKRNYDSLLGGFFIGFTNSFALKVVTNGALFQQSFSRAVLQPDLVFSAGNLPAEVTANGIIFNPHQDSTPATASINTTDPSINGPGTLAVGNSRGSINIRFQKIGPIFLASVPSFISELGMSPYWRWGSFDGTTNEPVLYPSGASIKDLERQVLGQ